MADPGVHAGTQATDDVTGVLNQAVGSNAAAPERLYALLDGELLRLARPHLAGSGAVSLNPSAIVHDACLRMRIRMRDATPMRDRRAFFANASSVSSGVATTNPDLGRPRPERV